MKREDVPLEEINISLTGEMMKAFRDGLIEL
jgi:hypothetical protein